MPSPSLPAYQRRPPAHGVLVTIITTHKRACLDDPRRARCVTTEIAHCEQQGWVESLAWVVMPDHLHWLLRVKDGSLNACLAVFKSRSERAIQTAIGRPERIWQAGYHERALRESAHILDAARCVVSNPVRRGLVERAEHFPYGYTVWPEPQLTSSQATAPPPAPTPTPARGTLTFESESESESESASASALRKGVAGHHGPDPPRMAPA